jgi:hypothetical protein
LKKTRPRRSDIEILRSEFVISMILERKQHGKQ